jgi:hypothetical protein
MESGSRGGWGGGGWWGRNSDKSRFLFTGVAQISEKRFLLGGLNEELLFRLFVLENVASPVRELLLCSGALLSKFFFKNFQDFITELSSIRCDKYQML